MAVTKMAGTDRGKSAQVGRLVTQMRDPANWDLEDEALQIAYAIESSAIRARALRRIADALTMTKR